jgi:putative ABC transport system permease protein
MAYNTFNILTPKLIDGIYDVSQINSTPITQEEYELQYNKVPLSQHDETYTYLTTTNSAAKIMGIKPDSEYIKLTDINGHDLKIRLNINAIPNDHIYPIIVNAYAAHKYGLGEGSVISFDINNKTDRYQNELRGQTVNNNVKFRVVGINTTYEGEEYFTSQQVANAILGLRSTIPNTTYDLHN